GQQQLIVTRLVEAQRNPGGLRTREPANDQPVAIDRVALRVRRDEGGTDWRKLVQDDVAGLNAPAAGDPRWVPVLRAEMQTKATGVGLAVDGRRGSPGVVRDSARRLAHAPPFEDVAALVVDCPAASTGSQRDSRRAGEECRRPAGSGGKQARGNEWSHYM